MFKKNSFPQWQNWIIKNIIAWNLHVEKWIKTQSEQLNSNLSVCNIIPALDTQSFDIPNFVK